MNMPTAEQAGSNGTGLNATQHLTILGWAVLLIGLYAWNHTKTGHTVLFYGLALSVLYLFVRNYNLILPKLTKEG